MQCGCLHTDLKRHTCPTAIKSSTTTKIPQRRLLRQGRRGVARHGGAPACGDVMKLQDQVGKTRDRRRKSRPTVRLGNCLVLAGDRMGQGKTSISDGNQEHRDCRGARLPPVRSTARSSPKTRSRQRSPTTSRSRVGSKSCCHASERSAARHDYWPSAARASASARRAHQRLLRHAYKLEFADEVPEGDEVFTAMASRVRRSEKPGLPRRYRTGLRRAKA